MKIRIDRSSDISIRQQLKGAIENDISFGDKAVGDPLPSVRELAQQVGVAPVTVSKVYTALKAEGLIEARSGSGTFVADSALARIGSHAEKPRLQREIDAVFDLALKLGCTPSQFLTLVNGRIANHVASGDRKRIIMLGRFDDATASYARCIERQVGRLATVDATTMTELKSAPELRAGLRAGDLVLTFSYLEDEARRLLPEAKVLSLHFIPSEATRMALASIDPDARVGVVSRFADFLPILSLGVRRFAAHLQYVTTHAADDPSMPEALADCDVVILSTGAEEAAKSAPPEAVRIEYRHVPDPGDINARVIPLLTQEAMPEGRGRKEAS
ncbi:GntR family transcriptional regulator [Frigidibacter sp. ROC022]|uniref:GntR family transcriptional regulator n=1 Tax=Frigidibacter sp. ROC022 TaxID=2971796 RepID=UPI00215A28B6|nr:GntR family transcriptional regulator [Frigidibacter sp. ROC022]MCR8725501.1 GntR family transcriptional regulator [Frigidibacter sp. ROC022]